MTHHMKLTKNISPHGHVAVVSTMKDEGPYVLEWFAHYMALGFTDILVYTNDCTDGTDEILIRLEDLGLGYHRKNKIKEGINPQPSMIKTAQEEQIVQESDWVLILDADEFLVIKYGDGTISDVLSAAGDAHGIVITWRIFGSSFIQNWAPKPVTEQFTYAAPTLWNKGWGVKTLFRFDHEKWKLGIHRPTMKRKVRETDYPDSIHWLNGAGKPMEDYFKFRGWRSIRRTIGYDWLQMNHYALKSMDAYAMRKFRGNANYKLNKYNADYWSLQDRNEVQETSISRHFPRRREIMAELLKDPVLQKLHHNAIDHFQARLAKYKKTDEYKEMVEGFKEASKVPITEVVANPPKPRDPAKIASMMSGAELKNSQRPKHERRNRAVEGFSTLENNGQYNPDIYDISHDIPVENFDNNGVILPADARVFTPGTLEDITKGKFDRRSARHIMGLVKPKDRVLNIGSGICFIPILICKRDTSITVLAHEDRKPLKELAEKVAKENDVNDSSRLKIVDGALFFPNDSDEKASGLQAYINDFQPNVLRICDYRITIDIIASLSLASIKRIIHIGVMPQIQKDKLKSLINALPGFIHNTDTEKSGVAVLDRTHPK